MRDFGALSFGPPPPYPKDPAALKIVRVVNSLRVVVLVRQGDLLSRRTLCGHQFPGITDIFPLQEGSAA